VGRLIEAHEASRRPAPGAREREKELLETLREGGEITPATAAMRTSLTVDEASEMLEELARKGHLERQAEEGVTAYSLGESRKKALPNGGPAPDTNQATTRLEDPLSQRELEVLDLLAMGKTNSEVARDLFVSVGTVKSHTGNIYRKLGARNRTEALARARDLDLIR
jgi:DNA-binding NarL/FixJ family response regulator